MKLKSWKKKGTLVTSVVLTAVILGACGSSGAKDDKKSETASKIKLSAQTNISYMDSRLATDESSIQTLNQTNEGLYTYDLEGKLIPAAAKEKAQTNKDKTVYTFTLRDDAKWSNDKPVTAEDFVYAWKSAVDPKTGSQYSYLYDGVVKNATAILGGKKDPKELGIKAVDDKKIEVTLEKPVPYFESLLAFSVFFPLNEEFVKDQGDKYAKNSEHILFNGPYKMKDWDPTSDSWTLVKNDKYWDKKNVKTDTFVYNVIANSGTGANLFETGELDRAELTGDFAKQYKSNENFVSTAGAFMYYIKYSQKVDVAKTGLDNLNLRKALNAAIDSKGLTEHVLSNGSTPAEGIVPANFVTNPDTGADFRKDAKPVIKFDATEAKKLLELAKKETGKSTFTIELLNDDADGSKPTAEYIQDQWQKNLPGVKVSLKTLPYKNRLELNASGDFQAQLTRWGPDYQDPSTYIDLFKTGSSYNMMDYSNPKFDDLLVETSTTQATKPLERWNTYIEAEKIAIKDDAASAPLYQNAIASLENPKLKNFKRFPYTMTALKYVYLEK